MFEIEHHSNLAEITGRPGLSWSVCKTLHINHIKDIADEQISNAGRKLAALEKVLTRSWRWRHREGYLPLQVAVGHASTSPIMSVPFPSLPPPSSVSPSPTTFVIPKASPRCRGLVAVTPTVGVSAWFEKNLISPSHAAINFPDICQQWRRVASCRRLKTCSGMGYLRPHVPVPPTTRTGSRSFHASSWT